VNPYKLLRYRNDLKAVVKGRIPQRLARRLIYGRAFSFAGWLSRLLGVSR
jgi:hypothetical protein